MAPTTLAPVIWSRLLATCAMALALAASLVGCALFGTGDDPEYVEQIEAYEEIGQPRQRIAPPGEGVLGYNEPLVWHRGVGFRAVSSGDILAISISNRTSQPLVAGPEQFRLLLPTREQYRFETGRDDLSGFPVYEIGPGQSEVFTIRVPRLEMVGLVLVFNYPPLELLERVRVERVAERPVI